MARTLDPAAHALRRDAFVDSAQRLMQARGYEEMTIQDVLDDLDTSRGAFYHYFDSKAALLDAVVERMVAAGIRASLDARSETLKYRIAEGARMKTPYMCVIGRREAEADQVAVNTRGAGEGQKPAPVAVDEFIARISAEVGERSLSLTAGRA